MKIQHTELDEGRGYALISFPPIRRTMTYKPNYCYNGKLQYYSIPFPNHTFAFFYEKQSRFNSYNTAPFLFFQEEEGSTDWMWPYLPNCHCDSMICVAFGTASPMLKDDKSLEETLNKVPFDILDAFWNNCFTPPWSHALARYAFKLGVIHYEAPVISPERITQTLTAISGMDKVPLIRATTKDEWLKTL